jgi:hypothetical protein
MKMGGFGYVSAALTALIGCCAAAYSCWVMGRKDGVTTQEIAPLQAALAVAVGTLLVSVLNVVAYFLYYREDFKAWREERRQKAGPQLHALLARIRRERPNFDELQGPPPSGGFSKYTEVTPFELLDKALEAVKDFRPYRRHVKKLRREIARVQAMPRGRKDVSVLVLLVNKLEHKLDLDVRGYPSTVLDR